MAGTAEQNNKPAGWSKSEDVAQQTALAEGRAESLRQRGASQAGTGSAETEGSAEESAGSGQVGIENALGSQRSRAQNKPSAIEQLGKEAGKQLAKKALMSPTTWVAIGWIIAGICGILLILFIGFNAAMVYKCWQEGGLVSKGVTFYQYWSGDYAAIMNKIYSGTCAISDTATTKTTGAAASTETQNIPAVRTAQ